MTLLLALGILSGTLIDQNDARIASATIELQPGPQTARSSITGEFSIPNLPPGTYHLLIRQRGFQLLRFGPIELRDSETKQLPAITLKVGVKDSHFYDGTRLDEPRYKYSPAPEASLRGKSTAVDSTFTLTGGPRPLTVHGSSFSFDGISPGQYSLRATASNYAPFEIKELVIPPKTVVEIDGWIDPPECPLPRTCPALTKLLRQP